MYVSSSMFIICKLITDYENDADVKSILTVHIDGLIYI